MALAKLGAGLACFARPSYFLGELEIAKPQRILVDKCLDER
jgi:hypothetical protein